MDDQNGVVNMFTPPLPYQDWKEVPPPLGFLEHDSETTNGNHNFEGYFGKN